MMKELYYLLRVVSLRDIIHYLSCFGSRLDRSRTFHLPSTYIEKAKKVITVFRTILLEESGNVCVTSVPLDIEYADTIDPLTRIDGACLSVLKLQHEGTTLEKRLKKPHLGLRKDRTPHVWNQMEPHKR